MEPSIEQELLSMFSAENIIEEFNSYKTIKTDIFTGEIKMSMGVDGVDWKDFEKNLDSNAAHIIKRIRENRYFFKPFREVEIPKNPFDPKDKKKRTLSIACIRDIVVQRILYQVIEPYVERIFKRTTALDNSSFAYRKGKSAPRAALEIRKHIDEGYSFIIDGDIEKFFDEIPHENLENVIRSDFKIDGESLTFNLLRRFVNADRVRACTYNKGKHPEGIFYKKKPKRTIRTKGIPQGGVISGILANLYLHRLDSWIINELSKDYDLRFVRYADDFVIMTKTSQNWEIIEERVRGQLSSLGLNLHGAPKTKRIDLSICPLEFVGFEIGLKRISIKKSNIYRFKFRIEEILNDMGARIKEGRYSDLRSLIHDLVKKRISYKVLGNLVCDRNTDFEGSKCLRCKKIVDLSGRNWITFFSAIDNLEQLRRLDKWIRRRVFQFIFQNLHYRLKKNQLDEFALPSLLTEYYNCKKKMSNRICRCYEKEELEIIFSPGGRMEKSWLPLYS